MLLKYSNGWGHLIMSVLVLTAGIYLVVSGQQTTLGISMVSIVVSAWFIPNAAKQVATEVQQKATPAAIAQTIATATVPAIVAATNAMANTSGALVAGEIGEKGN